jgi:hypothetical protein
MPYITTAELPELLRPFIDIKLAGGSNAAGERAYADIDAAWAVDSEEARRHYPDCDIRGLTGRGVERQWDGKGEAIRWELIRRVTVGQQLRGDDGFLHNHPRATYHVIASRVQGLAA